jgi:hypothetical protein
MSTLLPLNQLERHDIGWFNQCLLSRRESVEKTLETFDIMDSEINVSHLSRATHLYKATFDIFENLREVLIRNNEFVHVEILHESSDLGIPYKLIVKHSNGKQIAYDGVQFHVSELIHDSDFGLQDIEKFASYYDIHVEEVLWPFENSLREILTDLPMFTFPSYSFYTVTVINWEALGLHNGGNAHLRLVCTDKNVFTITGLINAETGKDYHTYLGDSKTALQMIAHEEFHSMEINNFVKHFNIQRTIVRKIQIGTENETNALVMPFYRLFQKHIFWNNVKDNWKIIRDIYSKMPQGYLLIQAYKDLLKNKWAFINTPRQLWVSGEVQDNQEQVAYPIPNFYQAKLQETKLENMSDEPIKPRYENVFEELITLVNILKNEIVPVIDDEKTLLMMFQTEFSSYAIWFAAIAIFVSILTIIISKF